MTAPAIRSVAPAKLQPDPNQPRKYFPEASIRELADSIKARGQLHPIMAYEGPKRQLIILDGERRWRAAKLLKLQKLDVIVSDAGADTIERGIDQIAANQVRDGLTVMDQARWLLDRQKEGKTPNEIAAAMAKGGMKAMDQKRIARLVKLPELPKFAIDMIDKGTLPADVAADSAASLLALGVHKKAIEHAMEALESSIEWSGQATARDVNDAVRVAFGNIAIDLNNTYSSRDRPAVHFKPSMRCKGCPHYVVAAGSWCMNAKLFEEHNQEAKDAGLLPGGDRPKAEKTQTAVQSTVAQDEKVRRNESSLKERAAEYLRLWLIDRVLEQLPGRADLQVALVDYAALGRPSAYSPCSMHDALDTLGLQSLDDFVRPEYLKARPAEVQPTIAARIVQGMDLHHILTMARLTLGATLDGLWKVDEDFLKLLRKPALIAIAEKHADLPDGRRAWAACKTGELHAALLAAADKIPVAPILAGLYAEAAASNDEPEIDTEVDGDMDGDDD